MNYRQLTEQESRVETGAVRFGEDWTSLNIRGKHCFYYSMMLQHFINNPDYPFAKKAVEDLLDLLKSTNEATNTTCQL